MKRSSSSDKGERAPAGERGVAEHTPLHHNIYIISLAGGRQSKQKRDKQTNTQTYTSSLYIYHHHHHHHHRALLLPVHFCELVCGKNPPAFTTSQPLYKADKGSIFSHFSISISYPQFLPQFLLKDTTLPSPRWNYVIMIIVIFAVLRLFRLSYLSSIL